MTNNSFDDVRYFLLGLQVANQCRIFVEGSDEELVIDEEDPNE